MANLPELPTEEIATVAQIASGVTGKKAEIIAELTPAGHLQSYIEYDNGIDGLWRVYDDGVGDEYEDVYFRYNSDNGKILTWHLRSESQSNRIRNRGEIVWWGHRPNASGNVPSTTPTRLARCVSEICTAIVASYDHANVYYYDYENTDVNAIYLFGVSKGVIPSGAPLTYNWYWYFTIPIGNIIRACETYCGGYLCAHRTTGPGQFEFYANGISFELWTAPSPTDTYRCSNLPYFRDDLISGYNIEPDDTQNTMRIRMYATTDGVNQRAHACNVLYMVE